MVEVQVRSEFKDTALFRTSALSEDGTGTVTFKLPDNVTSWQVNLAAISPDLQGGTGQTSLKVTLPFFINDSLNSTYLSGDFPYVGVSSYGNDLKVYDTYHEIEAAVDNPLKTNMDIPGGNDGLTTLIFTDAGRGKLLPALYSLLYSGGSRLYQKYISYRA